MQNVYANIFCISSIEQKNNKTHKKWGSFFIFRTIKIILIYLIFFFLKKWDEQTIEIDLRIDFYARWFNGRGEKDTNSININEVQFRNYAKISEYGNCEPQIFLHRAKTEIESIKSSSSINENLFNLHKKMRSTLQAYHENNDWICSYFEFYMSSLFQCFHNICSMLLNCILYYTEIDWLAGR